MKRVRLTVVYRTSREVRSYSIKALAKKSRHLKLPWYLQKIAGASNKKAHKSFRKRVKSANLKSMFDVKTMNLCHY